MLRSALISTALIFSHLASAQTKSTNDFCSSTEGLDRIKSYLACQAKPAVAACAGLATALGGRMVQKGLQQRYQNLLENNREPLIRDVASELHDEWRAPRKMNPEKAKQMLSELEAKARSANEKFHNALNGGKLEGTELENAKKSAQDAREQFKAFEQAMQKAKATGQPFFEPRLKVVDGKPFDIANLNYDQLPEQFKLENRESARVSVQQIYDRMKTGKPLDNEFIESASDKVHQEWLKRNGSWAPAEQKLPFNQLSFEEAEKDRIMVRKALAKFTQSSESVGGSGFKAAMALAKKMGSKGPLVLGGVVGAGVFLASEAIDSTSTGCSEAADAYIHRDPQNKCANNYEVNQRVLGFLSQPLA